MRRARARKAPCREVVQADGRIRRDSCGIGKFRLTAAYVSVRRSTVLEGGECFGEQYRKLLEQMLTETEG